MFLHNIKTNVIDYYWLLLDAAFLDMLPPTGSFTTISLLMRCLVQPEQNKLKHQKAQKDSDVSLKVSSSRLSVVVVKIEKVSSQSMFLSSPVITNS